MDEKPISLHSDSIEPVHRKMAGELFMVRIVACPEPGSEDFGDAGGAYVNCYIDADDLRTAERRAISLIQVRGWRPERFDTWQLTCADCASDARPDHGGRSTRELVEEARREGESCVFHIWPIDAPDDDEEV
jgi:hypothetical protein